MSELTEQIRATCDSIAENQKKVYDLGFEQGKNLGGYSEGFEAGKKSQYDEFWDGFQNYGQRNSYRFGFAYSAYEYIRPKYKVMPNQSYGVSSIFEACTKLKKVEAEYFDFSQVPKGSATASGLYYSFSTCSALEEIEDINLPYSYALTYTFAWCGVLHTIARLPILEDTLITNAFEANHRLKNLTIDGTIGQNGFNVQWSTKLSKASWISIMTSASTTASITITGSLISVNKAFETNPGANDGSTSPEWLALKAARPTVSVSLV